MASLNLGFGGPESGGVYHSIYDDPQWFEQFGDPGFVYGAALSQVTTTTLLRLANAPLLPFEFGEFSATVRRYVEQIKKQSEAQGGFRTRAVGTARRPTRTPRPMKRRSSAAAAQTDSARLAKVNEALYSRRAGADSRQGPARPRLVPPSDLRARPVHRIRREDVTRNSRSRGSLALG